MKHSANTSHHCVLVFRGISININKVIVLKLQNAFVTLFSSKTSVIFNNVAFLAIAAYSEV